MAGRVNLNVPPRLIESARAAQYANREVQSAAEQARWLRGRAQQRQEAAKRALPQAQTADGRGGVFDAPAINRAPRIWRKRRPLTGGDVGLGFIYEKFQTLPTPFRYFSVGSADGSQWNTFAVAQPLSQYTCAILPCNQAVVIVFAFMRDSGFTAIDSRAFYITLTTVQEVLVPPEFVSQYFRIIGSAVRGTDRYYANYLWPSLYGLGYVQFSNTNLKPLQSASIFPDFLSSSSGVYAGLLSEASVNLTAQDALSAFGDDIPVLGLKANLATLGNFWQEGQEKNLGDYRGQQYGPIDDMQVTDQNLFIQPAPTGPNVFTPEITNLRTRPITLSDAYVHSIAQMATLPALPSTNETGGQFIRQVVAWDYHGGTYCRESLAKLGFAL